MLPRTAATATAAATAPLLSRAAPATTRSHAGGDSTAAAIAITKVAAQVPVQLFKLFNEPRILL